MPIDKTKMTKEMLKRAAMCQTADELIALAKGNGIDITKEEAESYLAELDNIELDGKTLDKVAGGINHGGTYQCPSEECRNYCYYNQWYE